MTTADIIVLLVALIIIVAIQFSYVAVRRRSEEQMKLWLEGYFCYETENTDLVRRIERLQQENVGLTRRNAELQTELTNLHEYYSGAQPEEYYADRDDEGQEVQADSEGDY